MIGSCFTRCNQLVCWGPLPIAGAAGGRMAARNLAREDSMRCDAVSPLSTTDPVIALPAVSAKLALMRRSLRAA